MCGNCREPNCADSCLEKLEKTLNKVSDDLKESYISTRTDITLGFGFQERGLRIREDELIRELETNYNQNLMILERFVGLLEFAKTRSPCERRRIVMYIHEQLKSKLGFDKEDPQYPKISFRCEKLALEQSIACYGSLENRNVFCSRSKGGDRNLSLSDGNPPAWALSDSMSDKGFISPLVKSGDRLSLSSDLSGKADSGSFEILDSSTLSNQSYCWSTNDKPEVSRLSVQMPLFPSFDGPNWLMSSSSSSLPSTKVDRMCPIVAADSRSWLWTGNNRGNDILREDTYGSDEGLETKMRSLVLKEGSNRPVDDIESSPLPCKSIDGEPLCKFLGGCAFQMASDALMASKKSCVKAWLARQGLPLNEPQIDSEVGHSSSSVPEPTVLIRQLREIGKSDPAMWLSSKRTYEMASHQSSEPMLLLTASCQDDNWKERWLLKRSDPTPSDDLDLHTVKKSKLANFLLDSQENWQADIEAILYRSPFNGRTANWLQPNRKVDTISAGLPPRLYGAPNTTSVGAT